MTSDITRPGKDDEPSLADRFIADSYIVPKWYSKNRAWLKRAEPVMARYRDEVRHAHRFELDNDFNRLATQVSSTTPAEKLLARLQYATLPYDLTWIEFDLRVKVREMRRMHGIEHIPFNYADCSDKLGLLLHRLSDTDFVCQVICEIGNIKEHITIPSVLAYFVTTGEHDWGQRDGGPSGCTPFGLNEAIASTNNPDDRALLNSRGAIIAKAALWGYAQKGDAGMLNSIEGLSKLTIPSFLMRHGEMGFSRFHRAVQGGLDIRDPKAQEIMTNLMAREATEFAGMCRWVVTVLSMLNEVPVVPRYQAPSGTIRIGLTQRRKLLDYHRVTLRLPKSDPIKWVERQFRNSTRKHRAHEVRAHWRTYVYEQSCRMAEHDWQYDHNEGFGVCSKCKSYRRLIHEHVRGDPNLGWVRKDYVVKTERQ